MRVSPTGPSDAKIALIGEAPGHEEEFAGIPFVGSSGQELKRMAAMAGIDITETYRTNVFHDRPPSNKFHLEWCRSKTVVSEAYTDIRASLEKDYPEIDWPERYTWGLITQGKYLLPQYLHEVFRLRREMEALKPNVAVALGGTALWALMSQGGISALRGTPMLSSLVPGLKVLPTYHPAYVQRVWADRITVIIDLMKAKRESLYPEIRRPSRKIWINPSIGDCYYFYHMFIARCKLLAFDTETANKQITCISFAPSPDIALVIPFVDKSKPGYNCYDKKLEIQYWKFVQMVLDTEIAKLAQNGLYDLQYLWVKHGISVRNYIEDTMLLHHSLFLELKKDLGFLGSVYTDEVSWKIMRTRNKDQVEKKDD